MIYIKAITSILLSVIGITANTQTLNEAKKEKAEQVILDQVRKLPEIKSFFHNTPKSYKPAIIIAGEPDSVSKYYWVKVGISNFDMFRTNFNFYIDPKTFEIRYLDELCNSGKCMITLQQWRHWRKTTGWKYPHTYRAGKLLKH